MKRDFFARDTIAVARDLLGREIIREIKVGRKAELLRARIVETEAYLQEGDPAAHWNLARLRRARQCSRGPTPRTKIAFGDPGVLYVYFIYGNYFMLNFVTEKPGRAGAVLIRAMEPLEGIETMTRLRSKGRSKKFASKQLCNGPAKLVLALGIDGSLNGKPIGLPHLAVAEGTRVKPEQIVTTTRVGINAGCEHLYRFYEKGSGFVSKL